MSLVLRGTGSARNSSRWAWERFTMPEEIALFGGSFDPPHVGHLLAPAYVLAVEPVDELWLAPALPHPLGKHLSPPYHPPLAPPAPLARHPPPPPPPPPHPPPAPPSTGPRPRPLARARGPRGPGPAARYGRSAASNRGADRRAHRGALAHPSGVLDRVEADLPHRARGFRRGGAVRLRQAPVLSRTVPLHHHRLRRQAARARGGGRRPVPERHTGHEPGQQRGRPDGAPSRRSRPAHHPGVHRDRQRGTPA